MKKRLFLTGPMGCGKSQIIRETLGNKLMTAGGFITDMALDEKGMLAGMDLYPAAAAVVSGFEGGRYLDCSDFPPAHDNEVFRELGVRLLQEAEYYPFAVLDEFGGYETVIPQYRVALFSLLKGELPCIGSLKPKDETDMMRQSLGLGERVNEHVAALWELMEQDGDTEIIDLEKCSPGEAERLVQAWVNEYC